MDNTVGILSQAGADNALGLAEGCPHDSSSRRIVASWLSTKRGPSGWERTKAKAISNDCRRCGIALSVSVTTTSNKRRMFA